MANILQCVRHCLQGEFVPSLPNCSSHPVEKQNGAVACLSPLYLSFSWPEMPLLGLIPGRSYIFFEFKLQKCHLLSEASHAHFIRKIIGSPYFVPGHLYLEWSTSLSLPFPVKGPVLLSFVLPTPGRGLAGAVVGSP